MPQDVIQDHESCPHCGAPTEFGFGLAGGMCGPRTYFGFGLAGGGYGSYTYCEKCQAITSKSGILHFTYPSGTTAAREG
jgi:hypothetical protein